MILQYIMIFAFQFPSTQSKQLLEGLLSFHATSDRPTKGTPSSWSSGTDTRLENHFTGAHLYSLSKSFLWEHTSMIPLCSYDMRGGRGIEEGAHTSEKEPFGSRAFFRVGSDPAFLLINDVRSEVNDIFLWTFLMEAIMERVNNWPNMPLGNQMCG